MGDCSHAGGEVLDMPSAEAFLKTLPCLAASDTRDKHTRPETAPVLHANDGCEHGLFGSPPWLRLLVTTAGVPYTIEGVRCEHNKVTLGLYDASGKKLLAQAAPAPAPGCQVLRHTFEAPGTYALKVERWVITSCA